MALPVAIQLFSVKNLVNEDPVNVLKKIKEIGYEGIELCAGTPDMDPDELIALCKELDLTIISAHVGAGEIVFETENTLELYKKLGVSYVTMPALWGDYAMDGEKHDEMISLLKEKSHLYKENGIQICYHNHEWEFKKKDGEFLLDRFFNSFENGEVLPQIDTCWAAIGCGDALGYVKKYSGKCPTLHIKDFYCKGSYVPDPDHTGEEKPEGFELRPVGYGRQDMPAIMDLANEIGTKWLIVEQDAPSLGKDALECARLSRQWLKDMGN